MAACHDTEGWAVVSELRPFDLTPCFEEGILLSSFYAALLIAAVLACFRAVFAPKRELERASRWILWAKLTILAVSFTVSIVNLVLIVLTRKNVPVFQSYILEPIAILSALALTYINHTRARRASTILLLYWPLYALALAIWGRTLFEGGANVPHVTIALRLAAAVCGLLSFILECFGPETTPKKTDADTPPENPVLTANVFSRWTFSWMTPLMKKGASQYITENDIPSLKPEDDCVVLGSALEKSLKTHTLWKALVLTYGGPYILAASLKLIADVLNFVQPQLLRWLLSYISVYQMASTSADRPHPLEGFCIAAIMFITSMGQTIIINQYFQDAFETGMRVRAGMVAVIYDKTLALSNDERSRSSGDIVNLMSVDAMRLQEFCTYGLIAISGPFQITLAFISLYNLLGWAAFVGVAIMVLSIPLNTVIARILKNMQVQQMKNRDKRTRLMSELLNNIKSIKLYAWENAFIRKIFTVRNDEEVKMLRKIGIATSLNMSLWSGIPLLVAFSSLAVAAVTMETPITSDIIFPSISLFMLLQFPLAMFSQVTSNIIEAIVSINRLNDFLSAEELQPDSREVIVKEEVPVGDEVLTIKNADFTWSAQATEPTLEDINLTVKKGELLGVLGRVGCGKTSLLSAIIGDMVKREGHVTVNGTIAYAPQNPWILSATVRENILFHHEYDEAFYNLVIEACALGPDLALLADGDMTEVGEKGITMSGGQRARIALARAVYARADLVLLDDCLSAVDSHVAKHIFNNVIGPNGILASKARILVTNSIAFIKDFDHVVFIRRGIILEQGSYMSLIDNGEGEISKLVQSHGVSGNVSGSATPRVPSERTVSPTDAETEIKFENAALFAKLRQMDFPKSRIAPAPPVRQVESTGLSKEHMEQGRVKPRVYAEYIRAASRTGFICFLFAMLGQQAASVLGNLVLRSWGENNRRTGGNTDTKTYMIGYGLSSLASVLFSGAGAILLLVLCSLRSARFLHDSMLESLILAPLSFFELTPTGRTLNLFSRDVYVVDQILGRIIQGFCRTSIITMSIIIVIGVSFPPFLIAVIPLGWFYLQVMKYYLATSRELKRLDSTSRSPIFAWFGETLSGLSTIRAFNQQEIFIAANHRRVDRNQICYLSSISVNRWLSLRLESVGAMIIFIVAVLAMVTLMTTGVDAGLVGLVLSYAMNATSSLNWVVRTASEVEQNIVSVERILHQIDVQHEAPHEIPETQPDDDWPASGAIEFRGYSMRYREGLELVLKDLSMIIQPGEKIGICGRTGAGKSSLLLALFRIIEPAAGTIFIDGVDITKIGLRDLRSSISIVPQSPDLFEGTLRENIDPVGIYPDADIWVAIGQAGLREYVETLPEGLDAAVREGGSSLSSGQRQLLCFARALLRRSRVILLDEATSNVDLDTDAQVQQIIRGPAFHGVTILTIAHRLNTILDYDRILVMEAGSLAEFDKPGRLLEQKESKFFSLVSEAGLAPAEN